ncbi:MAG: hypothetical protein U1E78_08845 [Gammaproteobacteria bacterium]
MTNEDENPMVQQSVQDTSMRVMAWAKVCGNVAEDTTAAIIGFIPNGLSNLYENLLKPIPRIGVFFQHPWVEPTLKLITGITIGQGVARDIARFFFRPIGFGIGAFIGSGGLADKGRTPHYEHQVGRALENVSGQSVGGAILSGLVLGAAQFFHPSWQFGLLEYSVAMSAGAGLGLTYRAMMLAAIHTVIAANAASTRLNADRAKKFATHLKALCKTKVRDSIKFHAREVIVQVNGHPLENLDEFFNTHLENVAQSLDCKIDRHINLLTHKAVHGDFQALRRLASLYPRKGKPDKALEMFLERVFNQRAVHHIKDSADTFYDLWQYRGLKN